MPGATDKADGDGVVEEGSPGPSELADVSPSVRALLAGVAASPSVGLFIDTGDMEAGRFTSRATQLEPGTLIADRYEVVARLEEGGFGVVYLGRDVSSGQRVAIKLVGAAHGVHALSETRVALFRRETAILAELNHPNIVALLDAGELDNGDLFAVMGYVKGRTLASTLAGEEFLEPAEAIRLMGQVLDALVCAHAHGVVHRDLKPANIMLSSTGGRRTAVVLDFGLAAPSDDVRDDTYKSLIAAEHVVCSPAYASPEQLRKCTVPATDLYAWGLILLESLTGRPAAPSSSSVDAMMWQASSDPVPIPSWLRDSQLGRVLEKAVAKPLDERYATAMTLLGDLEAIDVSGLRAPVDFAERTECAPSVSRSPSGSGGTPSSAFQRRYGMVAIFLAVLVAAIATTAWWYGRQIAPAAPDDAGIAPAADIAPAAQPEPSGEPQPSQAVEVTTDAKARCRLGFALACEAWLKELAAGSWSGDTLDLALEAHSRPCVNATDAGCTVHVTDEGLRFFKPFGTAGQSMIFAHGGEISPGLTARGAAAVMTTCKSTLAPHGELCENPDVLPLRTENSRDTVPVSPFFADAHEVSQADWSLCVEAGACEKPMVSECFGLTSRGGMEQGPHTATQLADTDGPVSCVSRDESAAYCRWERKRLLSEAEWALLAANAGKVEGASSGWSNGADASLVHVMKWDPADSPLFYVDASSTHDRLPFLARAGTTTALSGTGLTELVGNVAEWVSSPYDVGDRQDTSTSPQLGTIRGGSFLDVPPWLGPALGTPLRSDTRRVDVGFRCGVGINELREAWAANSD